MSAPSPFYEDAVEKDSLFSSEEAVEAVVEEVHIETSQDRLIEYNDEDLDALVGFIKNMTTLYNLHEEDWTEQNSIVIKKWFRDVTLPLLCVYYKNDQLICSHTLPDGPFAVDMMYFLREASQEFQVNTFHDNIIFGTVGDNIEGSLLELIRDIYFPMLLSTEKWPDSVKNEFCQNVQMFLARITDLHYKLYGLTILYVPLEVTKISLEDANVDKELIKRLEGIVVYWTKQIRVGLQDQDQNTPEDLLCPKDEFEFWKYRYENLLGLNHQLNNEGIQHICNILQSVQSTYVKQFRSFGEEIVKCIEESKSNIEYLNIIVAPCESLSRIRDPKDFSEKLPKIIQLIRFIWLNSLYFNTKEKITQLFRALSNQLILQCKSYIDLDIVFKCKETRNAIKMFQTCVDALTNYIKTYVLIAKSHTIYGDKPWDLDKAPIFNHIDSFIQRCKDMMEVCETMICFGRYDETEKIPKPMFGGAKGVDFDNWAERIEGMYNEALIDIDKVQFRILEVNASEWYDDILKFRTRMKDIEVVIENLTNAVFDNIANIEDGIESLWALHNYTKRKTLTSLFEGKTLLIYSMFKEEILDVKQDAQAELEMRPVLMPYFAGRAHMIKMKKHRLQMLKSLFDDAGWMLPCSLARDVFAQYEKLINSIEDTVLNLYRKWVDSLGEDINSRVNRSLMIKSATKPGHLECNIDRSILDIFQEANYWDALQYEIPPYVKSVYQKKETIKFMYECVLNVVLDYNKIISSLSEDERLLFKPLISAVEKKISPGLSKLTWGTDVGDEYIADCSNNTAELQSFVDDYKSCNIKIVAICEKICDSPLISLRPNYAYDINELIEELTNSIENVLTILIDYFQEIIQFLIFVFEGFEHHMGTMANQWIKYINNFDTLMEEALKICCKNSLELMYEALHGDGTTEPNPLIKLGAQLTDNRIKFNPSLAEVSSVISNIHKSLVEALTALPRLNDKFHVAETNFKSYSQIISEDEKCQQLQVLLNQELRVNVDKIKDYMQTWEPFRDLWEVDKDKFITRYEKEDPSALLFDSNIARYTEMANNVNIQETVTSVHFMQINCAELKEAIIAHCIEWQEKLCALLFKMTDAKIKELYGYIRTNSEDIMKEPRNLEEMQNSIILFDLLKEDIPAREETFPLIKEQILTLDKYNVPIPDSLRHQEKNIPKEWAAYLEVLDQAEKMLEYSKEKFKTGLLEQAEISRKEARELFEEFEESGPFTSEISAKDALAYLAATRAKLNEMRMRDDELRNELAIFGLSFGDNVDLSRLDAELATLELIWSLVDEWDKAWEKYKSGEFWAIETSEMEETAQSLFRKLTKLSREFKDRGWTIIEDTRARVDAFRRTLPLIGDLKNPAMRSRHWDKVRRIVEVDFDENSHEFNLEAIYAMEMHKFAEEINEISNAATMELQIENGIAAISKIWETMKFEMVPYRERQLYRIKSVDECFQLLEENLMQLSIMKSTRFVEPFTKEVDKWERGLSYVMESLEVGLQVQREWLYLEV